MKQVSIIIEKVLLKRTYLVCSIGEADPDTIRKYIENQG